MVGQRGITWHRFRGREMAEQWHGFSESPRRSNASDVAATLVEAFGEAQPMRAG